MLLWRVELAVSKSSHQALLRSIHCSTKAGGPRDPRHLRSLGVNSELRVKAERGSGVLALHCLACISMKGKPYVLSHMHVLGIRWWVYRWVNPLVYVRRGTPTQATSILQYFPPRQDRSSGLHEQVI